MANYPDNKTKHILELVNKYIPESADPELNYCLKCYYLGQSYDEEEVNRIIEKRNQELEEMYRILELRTFEELNKPVEETKSNYITNGESETTNTTS